VIYYFNYW